MIREVWSAGIRSEIQLELVCREGYESVVCTAVDALECRQKLFTCN
jgi:hypothetical protein